MTGSQIQCKTKAKSPYDDDDTCRSSKRAHYSNLMTVWLIETESPFL